MKAKKKHKKQSTGKRPHKSPHKSAGRDAKGHFVHGNKVGKRFGEGQPTDRGGRPEGPTLSEALRRAWMKLDKGGRSQVELFAENVVDQAVQGDLKAGQFAADRAFGPLETVAQVNVRNADKQVEYVNDWRKS